jgi:hypothetical protein
VKIHLQRKESTMTTSTKSAKSEKSKLSIVDNKKRIENHKKAATHFDSAAKHHNEAAKHHENGDHEKAAQSTMVAHGHQSLGRDAQREDIQFHAKQK